MPIIERSHREEHSERVRAYHWTDCPGAGFSFDVDENDNPVRTEGNAHNFDQLEAWIASGELVDDGIEVREWSYRVPARFQCHCGEVISLEHFTNECRCGADYNSSGQRLAPREQWGEETGEHLSDILRIP
jgi:hypothetical protein